MIPLKIISLEEAKRLGLTGNKQIEKGNSVFGTMVVMKKNDNNPDELMEKSIIKENGKRELIFIHKERKEYFKKKKNFEDYLNQFEKIEGKPKETYLKENNLK